MCEKIYGDYIKIKNFIESHHIESKFKVKETPKRIKKCLVPLKILQCYVQISIE